MEGRSERLDLLHQRISEPRAGDVGNPGNVVDRLLGVEFGALPARLVENVDKMRFHVEQAELEHREEPNGARADDQSVGGNDFGLGQHGKKPFRNSQGAWDWRLSSGGTGPGKEKTCVARGC